VCAVKSGPLTLDALGVDRGKRGTTKSLRLHEEWQHMNRRALLMAMRVTFGLLALTAIGRQFVIQVQSGFSIVNFFSFFTNLSNIFAAVVLLRGAALLSAHRRPSGVDELLRCLAVVYMAVVGVVFAILLRGVELGSLLPWVNVVLHYIMPVAVVVEWMIQPSPARTGAQRWLIGQTVPLLYLAYVLIRGAIVGWYPYPFLDPELGGYGRVAGYVVGIMLLFLFAYWAVTASASRVGRSVDAVTG